MPVDEETNPGDHDEQARDQGQPAQTWPQIPQTTRAVEEVLEEREEADEGQQDRRLLPIETLGHGEDHAGGEQDHGSPPGRGQAGEEAAGDDHEQDPRQTAEEVGGFDEGQRHQVGEQVDAPGLAWDRARHQQHHAAGQHQPAGDGRDHALEHAVEQTPGGGNLGPAPDHLHPEQGQGRDGQRQQGVDDAIQDQGCHQVGAPGHAQTGGDGRLENPNAPRGMGHDPQGNGRRKDHQEGARLRRRPRRQQDIEGCRGRHEIDAPGDELGDGGGSVRHRDGPAAQTQAALAGGDPAEKGEDAGHQGDPHPAGGTGGQGDEGGDARRVQGHGQTDHENEPEQEGQPGDGDDTADVCGPQPDGRIDAVAHRPPGQDRETQGIGYCITRGPGEQGCAQPDRLLDTTAHCQHVVGGQGRKAQRSGGDGEGDLDPGSRAQGLGHLTEVDVLGQSVQDQEGQREHHQGQGWTQVAEPGGPWVAHRRRRRGWARGTPVRRPGPTVARFGRARQRPLVEKRDKVHACVRHAWPGRDVVPRVHWRGVWHGCPAGCQTSYHYPPARSMIGIRHDDVAGVRCPQPLQAWGIPLPCPAPCHDIEPIRGGAPLDAASPRYQPPSPSRRSARVQNDRLPVAFIQGNRLS